MKILALSRDSSFYRQAELDIASFKFPVGYRESEKDREEKME